MKRSSLVSLVLLLVASAAGLWWGLRGDRTVRDAQAPRVAAESSGSSADGDALVAPAPAAPAQRRVPPSEEPRTVTVEVELPPGTPADEELRLVALAGDGGLAELESALHVPSQLERVLARMPAVRWSRHALAHGGATEVSLPVDVSNVLLESRYLRVGARAVPDGERPTVRFAPELGGWLELVWVFASPGLASEARSVAVQGSVAQVDPERRGQGETYDFGVRRLDEHEPLVPVPRFELRAAPVDVQLGLVAGLPGRAVTRRFLRLAPGEHRLLELPLREGGSVSGTIRRAGGEPVANASVHAQDWLSAFVSTDERGRYEITGLRPGTQRLVVHEGREAALKSEPFPIADGEHRELDLTLPGAGRIAGRVLWPDGTPAAGARVTWATDRSRDGAGAVRADEAGGFEAGPLAGPGPWTLEAEVRHDTHGGWARASVVPGDTADLVLTLEDLLALEGCVVDERGEPAVGYRLDATPSGSSAAAVHHEGQADDGRFRLLLHRGAWRLELSGAGRADTWQEVRVPYDGALVLTLPAAGTVRGVVVDPDGQPVAGATVSAPGVRAQSDGEGAFELAIMRRPAVLRASHPAWADAEPVDLGETPLTGLAPVELRLRAPASLVVEVRDGDGRPWEGCDVALEAERKGSERLRATSDAAGRARFDGLAPGRWVATARPDLDEAVNRLDQAFDRELAELELRFPPLARPVVLAPGERGRVVLQAASPEPVRLSGRVRMGGEPVSGAWLAAIPSEEGVGVRAARTDDEGRYELALARPGAYDLLLRDDDALLVELPVDVPSGPEVRRDLDVPEGRIAGRVLDAAGRPAPGLVVRVEERGSVPGPFDRFGGGGRARTDDEGAFEVANLRAGSWLVHIAEASGTLRALAEAAVADGETARLDVRLVGTGTVEGRVLDPAGRPVPRARVLARDAAGRLLLARAERSDAIGRFRLELPFGRATLFAVTDDRVSDESDALEVGRGGGDATLVLRAGTLLTVEPRRGGHPVHVALSVVDARGREVGAWQAWGEERSALEPPCLGPVLPGAYTLHATTADGRSVTRTVEVGAGEAERTIRLVLD